MEGLKLRSFILCGLMLVTAGLAAISTRPKPVTGKDETWMKKVVPGTIGQYSFIPSAKDPEESYHCEKMVYDGLLPTVGMLARVYQAGNNSYDVNLIASRDRNSFHDPRVCFTAQRYTIVQEDPITIKTKTRGEIPATYAQMTGPNGPTAAVFFYRGPNGAFYGTTMGLKWKLFFDALSGKADLDGVFYRFIPMQNLDKDALVAFVSQFMDESGKASGGYF